MNILYNSCKSGRCSSAFSLIELLMVFAILMVLFSLSLPSLHRLIQRCELLIQQSRLVHAITLAKSMAVAKNEVVELCGSGDGRQCDGDWNGFWLLQTRLKHQQLYKFSPVDSAISVAWRGNFKKRSGIYFNGLGETLGQQGRFILTVQNAHHELILISSGRLRPVKR